MKRLFGCTLTLLILASCVGPIEVKPNFSISGMWKAKAGQTITLERIKPRSGESQTLLGDARKEIATAVVESDGSFHLEYTKVDTTRLTPENGAVYLELEERIILEPNKNLENVGP